tara:strand:- start:887 stop:1171 length:285 start_codon:yes stop_codon:yes gene_type:complete
MGIISAIIALLRAVPSLERLFLKIADGVKEARAKERFNAKLNHIDDAIAAHRLPDGAGVEWSAGVDRAPPLPEGGTFRTSLDGGGVEESSGTGI